MFIYFNFLNSNESLFSNKSYNTLLDQNYAKNK